MSSEGFLVLLNMLLTILFAVECAETQSVAYNRPS